MTNIETRAIKRVGNSSLSDAQLRRIVDSGVVGVVFWDTTGRIYEANDRFLEITGYDRRDLKSGRLDWMTLTPSERHASDALTLERLKSAGIARAEEKEYLRKDATRIFVRLHSTTFDSEPDKVLSLVVDVSEQKAAQQERDTLLDREKALRCEAESAVRSRDDILAIVSHDLRNPLHTIAMCTSLLEAPLAEPRKSAQLGIIRRAIAGMDRLIQDLLDVNRIASGQLAIEPRAVEAASLIEEARVMHEPQLTEKSQQFGTALSSTSISVLADRSRISQVFSNLIGNASKFAPEGGRVGLRVESTADEARFTVTDSGPGIDAHDLPFIFERFWQARRVRRGGVGLGLAIAKGIVDAHGGRIWAQSSPGVGTSVFFTLPLAGAAPDSAGDFT